MADTFTQTTYQSWFSRIVGSFFAMLIGFVLVPGAIVLLFWNEGREVKTAKSLQEGAAAVIAVPADAVNPGNDQKLVHVTGDATTAEVLHDPTFGVSANAIRLSRKIEIYEWNEQKTQNTHQSVGGGNETTTTYSYEKKWSPVLIDSSNFKEPAKHTNPTAMLANPLSLIAHDVSLGAFRLPGSVIDKMPAGDPLPVTDDNLGQLPPGMKAKAQVADDVFYFGHDPQAPEIGDQKVSFTALKPGPFSVVARQTGDTFESYPTRAGREILLVEPGDVGADLMFHHAESENETWAWILRAVGILLLFLGLAMIFSPIKALADVLPFLGDILGMGTALAAALLTIVLSLLTISIAWIVYRPLLGGLLLAAAIAGIVWTKSLAAQRARNKSSPMAQSVR